jgi:hypothetical protein
MMIKKHPFLFILLIICILSCKQSRDKSDFQTITNLLFQQQKDWNDGNIDKYMEAYWKSDSLKFITKKGVTMGWNRTLNKYKTSYPDKSAMGILKFDLVSIERLSENKIIMVGKWTLTGLKEPAGGYFTLVWMKVDGSWKIEMDHTS